MHQNTNRPALFIAVNSLNEIKTKGKNMNNNDLDKKTYGAEVVHTTYAYWEDHDTFINAIASAISKTDGINIDTDRVVLNDAHVTDIDGLNQDAKEGKVYGFLELKSTLYIHNAAVGYPSQPGDIILG